MTSRRSKVPNTTSVSGSAAYASSSEADEICAIDAHFLLAGPRSKLAPRLDVDDPQRVGPASFAKSVVRDKVLRMRIGADTGLYTRTIKTVAGRLDVVVKMRDILTGKRISCGPTQHRA